METSQSFRKIFRNQPSMRTPHLVVELSTCKSSLLSIAAFLALGGLVGCALGRVDEHKSADAAAGAGPASTTAATGVISLSMVVDQTQTPAPNVASCDPAKREQTCAVAITDYSHRYWRLTPKNPGDTIVKTYVPPGSFQKMMAALYTDKGMLVVTLRVTGPDEPGDLDVPVAVISRVDSQPLKYEQGALPVAFSPWVLGSRSDEGDVAIAATATYTDTIDSHFIGLAKFIVNGLSLIGGLPSKTAVATALNSTVGQNLETFENDLNAIRGDKAVLNVNQTIIVPAYVTSIRIYQAGFVNNDQPLLELNIDSRDSIFTRSLADDWLPQDVLGATDKRSNKILAKEIEELPSVSDWEKKRGFIGVDLCQDITKVGESAGLAPVDQSMLAVSWLRNHGWNSSLSTRDDDDSCYHYLSGIVPNQATAVKADLVARDSLDRNASEQDTADTMRESADMEAAYVEFSGLLRGLRPELYASRLAKTVNISANAALPELDKFFGQSLNETGTTYLPIELSNLLKTTDHNPLAYAKSGDHCYALAADVSSTNVTLKCFSLVRDDGGSVPLDVVITFDRALYAQARYARIKALQFKLRQV